MHQFKVKTTQYSVKSPERQLEIEALCAKIKRNTGRPSRAYDSGFHRFNSNPVYPRCLGGESTKLYVAAYERRNNHRFAGIAYGGVTSGESKSLFGELSDNPQWPQNDPVIEEPLND